MKCERKQQQWPIKYFINGTRPLSSRPSLPAIRASFPANPGFIGVPPASEVYAALQNKYCSALRRIVNEPVTSDGTGTTPS
jgi:hypothetical protein